MKDMIATLMLILNEYQRRIFLSVLSENLGWGSYSEIAKFTGINPKTLAKGRSEVILLPRDPCARSSSDTGRRVRAKGRGRKSKFDKNPEIRTKILSLLDGNIVGDPSSSLTWTAKSTRNISDELKRKGFDVSYRIWAMS